MKNIYTVNTSSNWIESSPNGELLSIERKEYGLRIFTVIKENGEEVSNIEGNGMFLGWYDNDYVLIQYDNEVRKVNVYNKEEEFYIIGEYDSYNPYFERFLKRVQIDDFESWQTIDKNGVLLNQTEPHYYLGFSLIRPVFMDENRIISRCWMQQYSSKHNGMVIKNKAVIMNLDGSNARRVTAFEE